MRVLRTLRPPFGVLRFALALATLVAALPACSPQPREPEKLPVQDVGESATAAMTPDADAVEKEHGPALSGSLPGNFPTDLPVFTPSSVDDFSTEGDAVRFVALRAEATADEVRISWLARLDRAGWKPVGGDPLQRKKGDRSIRLGIEPAGRAGTRIRIEY